MRSLLLVGVGLAFGLAGCEGWSVQPVQVDAKTPSPSRTPLIRTATAFILWPAASFTPEPSRVPAETAGSPSAPELTVTVSPSQASTTDMPATAAPEVRLELLACDRRSDQAQSGVWSTNAYVTISNTGGADLQNVCATLRSLDEGSSNAGKVRCASQLPAERQVTFQLTVNAGSGKDGPIQVDLGLGDVLLQRVGESSCANLGPVPTDIADLGTPRPLP